MPESGFELADAYAFIKLGAYHAAPLPLTEVLIGNRCLGDSTAFTSIGTLEGESIAWVPWGRSADRVLAVDPESHEVVEAMAPFRVEPGQSLAGEPRDRIALDQSRPCDLDMPLFELLVLGRVCEMAGCLSLSRLNDNENREVLAPAPSNNARPAYNRRARLRWS